MHDVNAEHGEDDEASRRQLDLLSPIADKKNVLTPTTTN